MQKRLKLVMEGKTIIKIEKTKSFTKTLLKLKNSRKNARNPIFGRADRCGETSLYIIVHENPYQHSCWGKTMRGTHGMRPQAFQILRNPQNIWFFKFSQPRFVLYSAPSHQILWVKDDCKVTSIRGPLSEGGREGFRKLRKPSEGFPKEFFMLA